MPRKPRPKQEVEALDTLKNVVGVLKQEVLMPGARCIALTRPLSAGAESFVFQASGVRHATRATMPNKFGALWIAAFGSRVRVECSANEISRWDIMTLR